MKKRAVKEGKQYARLAAYAAAAGATLASAGAAEAGIVYYANQNKVVTPSSAQGISILGHSLTFSLINSGTVEWRVTKAALGDNIQFRGGASLSNMSLGASIGSFGGQGVNPYRLFNSKGTNYGAGKGYFGPSLSGYIGFHIGSSLGPYNYGWIHVATSSSKLSYTIDSWAYESTTSVSGNIAVGATTPAAVPEPTSCALALIALGAGGLAIHRRRRQERDALKDQVA